MSIDELVVIEWVLGNAAGGSHHAGHIILIATKRGGEYPEITTKNSEKNQKIDKKGRINRYCGLWRNKCSVLRIAEFSLNCSATVA